MGIIDHDLQGHLAISTAFQDSTSLLYTDLGQPKGCYMPNLLLFFKM